ncbi:hypothetical protein V5E97_25090 [Singulisphaera sp. Ch08]|uniref:Uncharacterized protein n=1 Tax=Singulisphaera sp. Ch08 TaxID=3120278 RepID=A0AAU7C882_9BACT
MRWATQERKMTEVPGEEELAVLGSYLPRAFTIQMLHPAITAASLPTVGPLTIPRAAFPTFMHEISHLVQDISTFRGIMDFLNLWDQVGAAAGHVGRSGEAVPFPVVGRNPTDHRLNDETRFAIELDFLRAKADPKHRWTRGREWKFLRYVVHPYEIPLSGRTIEGRDTIVTLVDEATGEEYSHRLGAWEIKEAYAVAVGILHGGRPKRPESAGFEYMVVDRILAHYFDDVTPRQCVAICHWALQDLAPANTLFTLIEELEQGGRNLPPPEAIYDRARQEAISREFDRNSNEVVAMLRQMADAYGEQGNDVMEVLFRWYHDHAGRLLLLHLDLDRRFPLDTFLCQDSGAMTDAARDAALPLMFGEVHIPLLIWPDGSIYQISADARTTSAVMFNRGVVDLFSKVWRGANPTWPCPVYNGCNFGTKDGEDCLNRPWRKGWVFPTCPYGAAARVLGIDDGKTLVLEPFAAPPAPTSPRSRRGWIAIALLVILVAAIATGLFAAFR